MTELVQLLLIGLVEGSIIAITAVGLTLVYGILKIVNFSHGELLTFGAYAAFLMNVTWGGSIVTATLFAVLATALLGVALEFALWRPLRRKGAGMVNLLITSIGVALVVRHAIFLGFGGSSRVYDVDVYQVYRLGFVRLSRGQIAVVVIAFVAIIAVAFLLARTRLGKAMRAVSDNPDLASVAGVDIDRIAAYTWVIGGGLAGLGGVLQGLVQSSFNPNMGFTLLLFIFAAVLLGGVGSAYGALTGGLALGVLVNLSTWDALAGGLRGVYKPVVAFLVLIAVLVLRPQGVFGKARTL